MRQVLMVIPLLIIWACGHKNEAKMNNDLKKSVGTIEVVLFKTKMNVSHEKFTRAAAEVNPFMESLPGYQGRNLAKGPEGGWVDIVYWTDPESAQFAAGEVLKSESCQKFIGMIDESSMKFMHLTPVLEDYR